MPDVAALLDPLLGLLEDLVKLGSLDRRTQHDPARGERGATTLIPVDCAQCPKSNETKYLAVRIWCRTSNCSTSPHGGSLLHPAYDVRVSGPAGPVQLNENPCVDGLLGFLPRSLPLKLVLGDTSLVITEPSEATRH
jgi:hypothetical protein